VFKHRTSPFMFPHLKMISDYTLKRKKIIGEGGSATVYEADASYADYVHRHSMYSDRLAVRVMITRGLDWTKEIEINQYLNFHEIAHIVPLVHWMAKDEYGKSVDGFYNTLDDAKELDGWIEVHMTYPLMATALLDCRRFTRKQKIDVVFQLISMVKSLHRHRICHNDMGFKNILYRKDGEYIHLFLTDFGESRMECTDFELDYRQLVNNILFIVYDVPFYKLKDNEDIPRDIRELLMILQYEAAPYLLDQLEALFVAQRDHESQ